jgi:hemoglobin
MNEKTLYERLGGYDGITVLTYDLLSRLQADDQLGRFWQNRGDDGIERERQLLVDYLCSSTGGHVYYTGRDMKISHKGMKINEKDWSQLLKHAGNTLLALNIPEKEAKEVVEFVISLKDQIVES